MPEERFSMGRPKSERVDFHALMEKQRAVDNAAARVEKAKPGTPAHKSARDSLERHLQGMEDWISKQRKSFSMKSQTQQAMEGRPNMAAMAS